jgi:uncharacterized protein YndB with AHSA1/START domain
MIDVTNYVPTVGRGVGARTIESGEARTVTISRAYDTSVEDLWDACTNAERIPRWFAPVSGELELGGRYAIEGNASGTVTACDAPNGFDATWEFGGGTSWIEVRVTAEPGGGARLELVHIAEVGEDIWNQFGPGAVGIGWDLSLLGLYLYLSSGTSMDPTEAEAWGLSPEGLAFMTASNDGWCDAFVAFGADPADARARADRTIAFYSGAEGHPEG